MNKFISELLKILNESNVPISAATIGGSGILGALGKKKVNDLDVNINTEEFEKILKHPNAIIDEMRPGQFRAKFNTNAGEIEMFTGPWVVGDKDYMTGETPVVEIDGVKYWSPEHTLDWKERMNRPKDLADIELLKNIVRKSSFILSKRAKLKDKNYKILYHIGWRPAQPKPLKQDYKDRMPIPIEEGVFLSDNPIRVSAYHNIRGHAYAYQVPEFVIKESGG